MQETANQVADSETCDVLWKLQDEKLKEPAHVAQYDDFSDDEKELMSDAEHDSYLVDLEQTKKDRIDIDKRTNAHFVECKHPQCIKILENRRRAGIQ